MLINSINNTPTKNSGPNKAQKQWNCSPLHHTTHHSTFDFNAAEYPKLPKPTKNQNTTATQKPNIKTTPITTLTNPTITAKALKDQILADIQNNLTKLISKEMPTIIAALAT